MVNPLISVSLKYRLIFHDKNLRLDFQQGKYTLTDPATEQVVFSAPLNQRSQLQSEHG